MQPCISIWLAITDDEHVPAMLQVVFRSLQLSRSGSEERNTGAMGFVEKSVNDACASYPL